ncbi:MULTISPECIES: ROK family transcriptional regulator [Paenarthrobacter]|uniref:ROK family transcriptional regulator n=1 Tax=Paenarthrobacter TaxID=1742992 RepID=UPI00074D3685|nr:ROK family transcriptional regulator [Paenarthrobacter ureafaciens]AMB42113.1 ROK family transcriptional regulator [Arthrobacter sp. ATCC 21022]RWW94802.1 ROK family transcriptional regulator [Paenarthrobacter ureafaciens]
MTVVQTLPAADSQSRAKKAAPGFGASELFQILRDGRPRTRSELAAATGFARSTITARVEELLQTGFIAPVGDAASTGGRPPARVAFNPSARVVAAGDIGATHATVAVVDLAGTTLAKAREKIQIADGPESVLDWLTEAVSSLLSKLQRAPEDLIAVGIGLPGPVEHSTGKPSQPPIMPGWDGFDVPGYVQGTFDVAVLVDNDVNIMALGERAACWPQTDNMLFLKVATGIGSGIISSGQLQRGEKGTAGDVGHIAVNRAAGIACRCGNIGCLEAIAGRPAVARALRAAGVDVPNDSDVMALVRQGNILASQTMRQAGRDIGEVLNMCVSLLNPAVIVIGGSMAEAGEQLIAGIREVVYARSTPLATQDLSIVQARTGAEAGITGAAIMALDHVLAPENLQMLAASQ